MLQEQQQQMHRESATVPEVERDESASLAASSMTPAAGGAEQYPPTEPPHAMPHQQLLRVAEVHGAVYAVWGAFTSLLTAAATRRAVRRTVEQALLAPAAAALATFNRNCDNDATTTDLGSSTSSPPSPSRTGIAAVPPDPASFDCALSFRRDMAAAVRRMAGTVLARASSLAGIQAAARRLSDAGAGRGGEGAGFCSGSGVEEDEGRGGGGAGAAAKMVENEAVALVSEVAEVRVLCVCRGFRP